MKLKKNPKIDLERYRTHFLLAGFAISLGIVIVVFNINFSSPSAKVVDQIIVDSDEIIIPITIRTPPKVAIEQPKVIPSKLEIIDDNSIVDNELDMSVTETDEDEFLVSRPDDVRYTDGDVEVIGEELEDLSILEEPIPFAVVESVPIFPGCESASDNTERKDCFQNELLKFVAANYVYSEAARRLRIQGRIILSFVVEKNGSISSVIVLRSVDPWLDKEAIRVLSSLPQIAPAKQRGQPVRMSFVVPINVKLNE
jgi:protein TonB